MLFCGCRGKDKYGRAIFWHIWSKNLTKDVKSNIIYRSKLLEEPIVRLIHDDVYIFSVSRSRPGEVVACRTRHGDGAIGKNINDVLVLDKNDVKYARQRSENEEYRSICLSCHPEKKRKIVAFFDFMCRASSLCLAVVFEDDPTSVAKALSSLGQGIADISPSLVKLIEDDGGKFSKADNEAFINIAYLYGCIAPLSELRAYRHIESGEILRHYIELASEFIGVEVECFSRNDLNRCCFNGENAIFAGGFCTSAILFAAILARRFSREAKLEVEIVKGCDCAEIYFSFDIDGRNNFDSLDFLCDVAESYGIMFRRTMKNSKVLIGLVPFYCDVGLVGVKARDPYPLLSDFT